MLDPKKICFCAYYPAEIWTVVITLLILGITMMFVKHYYKKNTSKPIAIQCKRRPLKKPKKLIKRERSSSQSKDIVRAMVLLTKTQNRISNERKQAEQSINKVEKLLYELKYAVEKINITSTMPATPCLIPPPPPPPPPMLLTPRTSEVKPKTVTEPVSTKIPKKATGPPQPTFSQEEIKSKLLSLRKTGNKPKPRDSSLLKTVTPPRRSVMYKRALFTYNSGDRKRKSLSKPRFSKYLIEEDNMLSENRGILIRQQQL